MWPRSAHAHVVGVGPNVLVGSTVELRMATGGRPASYPGWRRWSASAQSAKPSLLTSGADGCAMTWLLLSTSCICSAVASAGLTPLVSALSKCVGVRLGSAAKPPPVPMISGVSTIHSAVAWVELYGVATVTLLPVETGC